MGRYVLDILNLSKLSQPGSDKYHAVISVMAKNFNVVVFIMKVQQVALCSAKRKYSDYISFSYR